MDSWDRDIDEQDNTELQPYEETDRDIDHDQFKEEDEKIFILASQQSERDDNEHDVATRKKRFGSPISESDILKQIGDAVPANTQKTTLWAVRTWKDWSAQRKESGDEVPCCLEVATDEDVNKWLARFVLEVRN